MSYAERILEELKAKNADQPEFIQAATEILSTLGPALDAHPEYEENALLERFVEPERVVMFRVPWVDDSGKVQVNRGYRVEFNSAIGPYKGGLRFNPTVTLGMLKFLGLEQILKNSLTTLPMGGGKGGSDFDPKGKSNNEIMHFCQSFMTELCRHIGPNTDVPAGDLGDMAAAKLPICLASISAFVTNGPACLTGKGLSFGGSLARTEATGYGLVYFVDEYLKSNGDSFEDKNVVVHGSGNVAIYAVQKVSQLGGKVLACSDTHGWVDRSRGHRLQGARERLQQEAFWSRQGRYARHVSRRAPECHLACRRRPWRMAASLRHRASVRTREYPAPRRCSGACCQSGCKVVGEGANMPSTIEATNYFLENGVAFMPGKAANAGGVLVFWCSR